MTVHSDWGDWLLRAVERADPDGLAVWYLGCNGFICKSAGGTTLFIDPYLGTGDPPRTVRMIPVPFDPADVREADAVFVTHEHTDHVHGPSQAPILERGADWYGPSASYEIAEDWTGRWAINDTQLNRVTPGDSYQIGDVRVTAIDGNDPDAVDPVGYVLEAGTRTFVHVGDSRPGQFGSVGQSHDIDVGAVAVGSTGLIRSKTTGEPTLTDWYNNESEAIALARELELTRLLPTHWDMWKGLTTDPTALSNHAQSFTYPKQVKLNEIGDRTDV